MSQQGEKAILFGVETNQVTDKQLALFTYLRSLLSLQTFKFWAVTYLVSLVVYMFKESFVPFYIHSIGISVIPFTNGSVLLNFLLFPFSVYLLGRMGSRLRNVSIHLYLLVFPAVRMRDYIQSSLLKGLLTVVKLLLFYNVWMNSVLIGFIAILVLLLDAKKLSK